MATNDCCFNFGGRITLTIDGTLYTPSDAKIMIKPVNRRVTAKANQDGSPCYMSEPQLPSADVKFRNGCGIDWATLMKTCSIDATISEEDNNRTHLFSGARLTGDPDYDVSTGEVTGLKIEGQNYQFLNS